MPQLLKTLNTSASVQESAFPSSWQRNPKLSLTSSETEALFGELESVADLLKHLVGKTLKELKDTPLNAGTLGVVLNLFTTAMRDLISLKTLCRAKESMSPQSSVAATFRCHLASIERGLEALASQLYSVEDVVKALKALPEMDYRALSTCALNASERSKTSPLRQRIAPTISSLHRHTMSAMRLSVYNNRKETVTVSYSQAVQILKSSTDAALRKSTFQAFNAWCAARSTQLADILNLTLATNLDRLDLEQPVDTLFTRALGKERISRNTYEALFAGLDAALPKIQEVLKERAKLRGEKQLHASMLLATQADPQITEETSVKKLLAFQTYRDAVSSLVEAYKPFDPMFGNFLTTLEAEHWIDAEHHSGKIGGTWCENFPASGSVVGNTLAQHEQSGRVVVFANFSQGAAGALQLSHPLAVGYLFHVVSAKTNAFRLPYSVLEMAGELGNTFLLRHLQKQVNDPSALSWLFTRQITSRLLLLPMRHQLMREFIAKRYQGELVPEEINTLTRTVWQHWLGDAVESVDQYHWAMKPHFFRIDRLFYDWQYTFGFLLSGIIVSALEALPEEKRTQKLRDIFLDSTALSFESLFAKHLGEAIDTVAFWKKAVDIALAPIPLKKRD